MKILAVLCVIYGFVVLSVGSGTGFFLVWFAAGGIFLLGSRLVKIQFWQMLPAPVKTGLILAAAAGLAVFVFTEAKIIGAFQNAPEPGLDYIIVLGAQVRENGPCVALQYRLDTAAEYLEKNPETICVVSGGQGYSEPFPEAVGMRDYLAAKGIDGARILMEAESGNTVQNMVFSRRLLEMRAGGTQPGPEEARIGIVTNDFHMYRACGIAKKAGFEHISAIPAPSTALYLPNNLLREFLGTVKDYLAGNL